MKDINSMNQQLIQANLELMKKKDGNVKEQVLIEDGTMSSFGFVNSSEVRINDNDKRN